MRTLLLFSIMLFIKSNLIAQNSISTAEPLDGSASSLQVSLLSTAIASNLDTSCVDDSGADIFFKHEVSTGDNRLIISMNSGPVIGLGTIIRYQIIKADTFGNIDSSFNIVCGTYDSVLLFGGGFEHTFDGVSPGDFYYLRVFKPEGLGGLLGDLLNVTTISMTSINEPSLSISESNLDKEFRYWKSDNYLKFSNDAHVESYEVYNTNGQLITKGAIDATGIPITYLNKGLYIFKLSYEANKVKTLKIHI